MKKPVAIGIAVGVVLLIGVFAIAFVPAREPISLTFVKYPPWPNGAKLKLTNGSSKNITYLTDQTGAPVLSLLKTSSGWTNTSPPIITGTHIETRYGTSTNIVSSTTNQIYFAGDGNYFVGEFAKLALRPGRGEFKLPEVLQTHTLQPGESTELYVSLEADGHPVRIGTVCIIPQGKLAQQFSKWIDRGKTWLRIKSNPPGQIEVWCTEPLQARSSPTQAEP